MPSKSITEIYNSLQELAWHFGSQSFDGECCENLSLAEFIALKKAWEGNELSIQEIGSTLNFTKSGATRIIDRLESKGYVKRERSPIDGRVCCVTVTQEGAEVTARIMEKYTAYLQAKLKELEPSTQENIRDSLDLLVRAINKQN